MFYLCIHKSKMTSFVIINAKGDIKQGKMSGNITDDVENQLAKALKRAKVPVLIGSWTWQKYKLFLYGYKEGRAGTENNHEFHAPHNDVVLYGDAVVIANLDDKPVPFTVEIYKKFYNTKDGGDDDKDDDDDEIDEDDEEEEEEEYEEDDGVEEDGMCDEEMLDEDEEEEIRPMLRIKSTAGFKKIAKWMHSPELTPDEYVL